MLKGKSMYRAATIKEVLADKKKMTDYICRRVPDDGTRIMLADGDEGGPAWVNLFPKWTGQYGWELLIETDEPEWVCLEEIYRYFRCLDMTLEEEHRDVLWELNKNTVGTVQAEQPHCEGNATELVTPFWDADLGRLWYGDKLIKAYREEAENQKVVLAAFQEQEWRHRIDDPIPGKPCQRQSRAKRRLRDTIIGLNADHITPGVIHFRGDGTGEGVIWEPWE